MLDHPPHSEVWRLACVNGEGCLIQPCAFDWTNPMRLVRAWNKRPLSAPSSLKASDPRSDGGAS